MTSPTPVLAAFVRLVLITGWIVTIAAVFSVVLRFEHHGGRLLNVQTGSMRPSIQPGDTVVVMPVALSRLQLGDIISYRVPSNQSLIVSHRVIAHPNSNTLVTKGDANKKPDQLVARSQIIGRVVAVAPGLGRAIKFASSPIGLIGLVYIPALAITLDQIKRVVRHRKALQYSSRTRG